VTFTYADLFAGIGGFHAALSELGGECVYASEIDRFAAAVYEKNWGRNPLGDITQDVNDESMNVPECDLLSAGFPCQPFSKSGAQRGMEETRGTLYWHILQILHSRKPSMVVLENVRNLAGPRHHDDWMTIIRTLRDAGYHVSDQPAVFSPHLLPPEQGGTPQIRERVFICATHLTHRRNPSRAANSRESQPEPPVTPVPIDGWDPQRWSLKRHLLSARNSSPKSCQLKSEEVLWIDAWDDFVKMMLELRGGRRLPGFPLWSDSWKRSISIPIDTPKWKVDFLTKNRDFYKESRSEIDGWLNKWDVRSDRFPPSRRKLEWQAQDSKSLWETLIQFRPSGIRAKRPTYVPALVAISQTSIYGPERRRLSVREAARLQGFKSNFDFGDQPDSQSFKQLGNGVSIGAVKHVIRQHALRDREILEKTNPGLLKSILESKLR
jgi:DNA (cytosine-5)-methyltransferase 1